MLEWRSESSEIFVFSTGLCFFGYVRFEGLVKMFYIWITIRCYFASLSITYLCSSMDITVLCLVTLFLNGSEAWDDLALTQTSLLLLFKRTKLALEQLTGLRRVLFDRNSSEIHCTIVARIYLLNLWLIQVTIRDRTVNMRWCYASVEILSYPHDECGIQ